MKKLLIVVDYQNDFVTGSLGFSSAKKLYPRILALIDEFEKSGDDVVMTRDVHGKDYLHTEEGRNLPVPHCLQGTEGALFYQGLEQISSHHPVFEKDTFGSKKLGEWLSSHSYDEIVLCGVDLSICVTANAIIAKTFSPNAHVVIDLSASGTGDEEAFEYSVRELRRLQIEVTDLSHSSNSIFSETHP